MDVKSYRTQGTENKVRVSCYRLCDCPRPRGDYSHAIASIYARPQGRRSKVRRKIEV